MIITKVFPRRFILSDRTTQSAQQTRTHPHRPPHTGVHPAQSSTSIQVKQVLSTGRNNGGKQQREREKHGRSTARQKERLRLDLNESREGFCRRGRGKSFHAEVQKTEKAREARCTDPMNLPHHPSHFYHRLYGIHCGTACLETGRVVLDKSNNGALKFIDRMTTADFCSEYCTNLATASWDTVYNRERQTKARTLEPQSIVTVWQT